MPRRKILKRLNIPDFRHGTMSVYKKLLDEAKTKIEEKRKKVLQELITRRPALRPLPENVRAQIEQKKAVRVEELDEEKSLERRRPE